LLSSFGCLYSHHSAGGGSLNELIEVDGAIAIGVSLLDHVINLLVGHELTQVSEQVGELFTSDNAIEIAIHSRESVSNSRA